MTDRCELCGRAMLKRSLTPVYWQHGPVCRRARCEQAAYDALSAVFDARDVWDGLVDAIAERHASQYVPVGYRTDEMARIQHEEDESWWANEVVSCV